MKVLTKAMRRDKMTLRGKSMLMAQMKIVRMDVLKEV